MDFFVRWVENDPSEIETDSADEEVSETIIENDTNQENLCYNEKYNEISTS